MSAYCPLCNKKHKLPLKGRELSEHRIKLMIAPLDAVNQWIANKNKEKK